MLSGLLSFGLLVVFFGFGLSRPCLSVLCWLADNKVGEVASSLFPTSLCCEFSLAYPLLAAEFLLVLPCLRSSLGLTLAPDCWFACCFVLFSFCPAHLSY